MIFAPIPNLIFSRDIGVAINNYMLLNKPAKKARARETLLDAVYIFLIILCLSLIATITYWKYLKQSSIFYAREKTMMKKDNLRGRRCNDGESPDI